MQELHKGEKTPQGRQLTHFKQVVRGLCLPGAQPEPELCLLEERGDGSQLRQMKEILPESGWREEQGDHVHPLFCPVVSEYMGQVLSQHEYITRPELPDAVSGQVSAFSPNDKADLYLLVLVQLVVKHLSPVHFDHQRGIIGFRYEKWEYFHWVYCTNINQK